MLREGSFWDIYERWRKNLICFRNERLKWDQIQILVTLNIKTLVISSNFSLKIKALVTVSNLLL